MKQKVQVIVFQFHGTGFGPEAKILVVKRVPARGGFWQTVSGNIEPGEFPPAAFVREMHEELGYKLEDCMSLITLGASTFEKGGETIPEYMFAVQVQRSRVPTLSFEHDAYGWLDFDEAIARVRYEITKEGIRRLRYHLERVPAL